MNELDEREEAIFEAAVQLRPEERDAYLTTACKGDDSLRKRIERLLQAHETAGGFLDNPAAAPFQKAIAQPAVHTEKPGEKVGHYKLLQQIGEGGCGVVYMAEQEEPVRRRVALKVIKLGMDTRSVIARFEAERQALALMEHPNIAKVLDAGATEAGRPYFVMELVRGTRITDYCDENNLSTNARLKLFTQICQAIQHAHQKGIIHRDIKPSNILVTLHDGVPVPKVIDFGIAKATTDQRLTDKTVFTAFEQFIGTPAYVSPEQAETSGLDIDTRSDIYALGVLLYELLTGKTPFDAKELLAQGVETMRRTLREKEPARPSTRLSTMQGDALTATAKHRQTEAPKLIHRLRGDLDWIVMKCLEKDRTRRYETANGLAMDVQRHLQSEPVIARPPSAAYRLQKLVRRNKLAVAAVVAVVIALLIGLGGALWQWRRAERFARVESRERLLAEGQATQIKLNLYASDINLASQSIQRGNFGLARRTLTALKPRAGEVDLRGFEWRYLWNLCQGQQLATLTGHEWIVSCAAYSPDGKLIATGSQDHTVKVWDAHRLQLVTTLDAATGEVWSVAFTPDGRLLITAGRGGTRLWDTESWELVTNFPGQVAAVSKRGPLLAVSDSDPSDWLHPGGPVSLWNYRTGTKLREWDRPAGALAFSPDGKSLAATGIRRGIDLWDVESGNLLRTIQTSNLVWSLAFSPDGSQLVTTAGAKEPMVWDLSGVQPPRTLKGHFLTVWSANYSPDGTTVVTTGSDQTVRLWDAATLGLKSILRGHDHEVWCACYSPDGRQIVTGGKDQKVMLWATDREARRDRLPGRAEPPPVFSPDGKRIVIAGAGKVSSSSALWNVMDCTLIKEVPGRRAFGFSTDGSHVIRWSDDGAALEFWSPDEPKSTRVAIEGIQEGGGLISYQGFSPDSKMFYVINGAGVVKFWETATGKLVGSIQAPAPPIRAAALGPGGRYFALGANRERVVRLYDRTTGRETQLAGHRDSVNSVAFSPDGATLASGSFDGTIRFWETATSKHLASVPAHMEEASAVAFSPDGRTLASVNLRHSIKLWHLATHRELVSLDFPEAGDRLGFSPDGRHLAVTTSDNFVRLFEAPTVGEQDRPE